MHRNGHAVKVHDTRYSMQRLLSVHADYVCTGIGLVNACNVTSYSLYIGT